MIMMKHVITEGRSLRKDRPRARFMVVFAIVTAVVFALQVKAASASEGTWGIYLYMCGSDLETNYGLATTDLEEIMGNDLPEGVTVVIETGGAKEWHNEVVDPEMLNRFVMQLDQGWREEPQPLANMGDGQTFADFLAFCHENYPADREVVIVWDHGGGSVGGVALDEVFGYESLSLAEIREAMAQVYEEDTENPPLEIVGFDACLMATVDTANVLNGFSRYMVASEETEPGCGWNYRDWLAGLCEDPSMETRDLGTLICDTYLVGCEEIGDSDQATLSVVDITMLEPLLEAYNNFGTEALVGASEDSSFFAEFGRGAANAENYGGNTPSSGYCNMVDLGDLAIQNQELLPDSSEEVLQALNDCVVYTVCGDYRTQATGISCYYSYNGDTEEYSNYVTISSSEGFDAYYDYMLNGTLDEEMQSYLSDTVEAEVEYTPLDSISPIGSGEELDLPVNLDEDGYAVLSLQEDLAATISDITFELSYYDEEEDIMIYLGSDNDIEMDWENGLFKDNFRGVWGSLDGCLCHMEVIYSNDEYTFYNVPILLNGENYQLKVVYDYRDEAFHILGANKGVDDYGMADKNTVQLQPGDEITTLHYASTLSGDDEMQLVEIDTFTVSEDTTFEEMELGDGDFVMTFRLEDARSESVYSESLHLHCENGEYTIEKVEDM